MASMISWAYGWHHTCYPSDQNGSPSVAQWDAAGISWMPMVWGEAGVMQAQAVDNSAEWNRNGRTRSALLGFNEPNFASQANLSPEQAVALWPAVEQLAARYSIDTLVAPAVAFHDAYQGIDWLSHFLDLCTGCRIDAIAIHSYTCYARFLKDHIDMYRRFGKRIWLTEFACAEGGQLNAARLDAQGQMAYMREAIPMLEMDPDVEKYAWFSYFNNEWAYPIDGTMPDAGLVRADGRLSDLGELYATFVSGA